MLPETGSISMSQVNVELKKGETTVITLNDTDVRKLAGKPSGIISMEDLRGKKASEYVENYKLFSGTFESTNSTTSSTSKDYTSNLVIPKNIIKGKVKVSVSYNGTKSSYTIPNFGSVGGGYGNKDNTINESKEFVFDNTKAQTIVCSVHAGSAGWKGGNGNNYYTKGYINVTVTFTGEWEA